MVSTALIILLIIGALSGAWMVSGVVPVSYTHLASYTRKQLDQLTEFVKRPQIGAKGMVYARVEADGNVKSLSLIHI